MPHLYQDAPIPCMQGELEGLALLQGWSRMNVQIQRIMEWGELEETLKLSCCSPPATALELDNFGLLPLAPGPIWPWAHPWISLFSWKRFLKHRQRATLLDLGTKTCLSPSSQLSLPFFPFPVTDFPADLLCHFLLLSYGTEIPSVSCSHVYFASLEVNTFSGKKTPPLLYLSFSFFPGQLFASGIVVYPVWILVAWNPGVLIQQFWCWFALESL